MKRRWITFWQRFGFYPEPLKMAGIYGVTSDGCYLVLGTDGVLRKSPPLRRERGAQ